MNAKCGRRGFTLVEVIVALVVMTSAIAILAQGFAAGGHASVGAQNRTTAAYLAESKIAELEAGILSLNLGQSGSFDDPADWRWEIASEPSTIATLYQIAVTVKWDERGQERTYSLVRLMRERPAAGNP